MVDTQNLATAPSQLLNTFNITNSNSSSYYRLVINKIFYDSTGQLAQWNLYGTYNSIITNPATLAYNNNFKSTIVNGFF